MHTRRTRSARQGQQHVAPATHCPHDRLLPDRRARPTQYKKKQNRTGARVHTTQAKNKTGQARASNTTHVKTNRTGARVQHNTSKTQTGQARASNTTQAKTKPDRRTRPTQHKQNKTETKTARLNAVEVRQRGVDERDVERAVGEQPRDGLLVHERAAVRVHPRRQHRGHGRRRVVHVAVRLHHVRHRAAVRRDVAGARRRRRIRQETGDERHDNTRTIVRRRSSTSRGASDREPNDLTCRRSSSRDRRRHPSALSRASAHVRVSLSRCSPVETPRVAREVVEQPAVRAARDRAVLRVRARAVEPLAVRLGVVAVVVVARRTYGRLPRSARRRRERVVARSTSTRRGQRRRRREKKEGGRRRRQ